MILVHEKDVDDLLGFLHQMYQYDYLEAEQLITQLEKAKRGYPND